ncbi:MAG: HAMP domain-containing methyl-accepting chemotaxis protein, partial [Spirochaetota bacterium]
RKIEAILLKGREKSAQKSLAIVIYTILFGTIIAIALSLLISIILSSQILKPIQKLIIGMSEASKGDFTTKVAIQSRDEFANLGIQFNKMLENVRSLVKNVNHHSNKAVSAIQDITGLISKTVDMSNIIFSNMQEANQITQEQTNMIHDGNNLVSSLINQINRVDELSNETSKMTFQSMQTINTGMEVMEQQKLMMKNNKNASEQVNTEIQILLEKSKEIGSIIKLISNIAKQTNLLALNAAIEAERSGEYGRGFSVVAEEIKTLAEESGKSTQKINNLITQIQSNIGLASQEVQTSLAIVNQQEDTVNTTVTTFENIHSSVSEATDNIKKVLELSKVLNAASEEAGKSFSTLAKRTEKTTLATQKTASTVEEQKIFIDEVNKNAKRMLRISEGLLRSTAKFTI